MKIEYVQNGLANNFGTFIELNESLKDNPKLHDAILSHELKHTRKNFTIQDLILDLQAQGIDQRELIQFMVKHPRTFFQLLPFYWSREKGFVYDFNLTVIFGILTTIIMGAIFIGLRA